MKKPVMKKKETVMKPDESIPIFHHFMAILISSIPVYTSALVYHSLSLIHRFAFWGFSDPGSIKV